MSEPKDKRTTGNSAAVPATLPPGAADSKATGNGAADAKATGNGAADVKATGNGAADAKATGNGAADGKATGNGAADDKAKKSGVATDDKAKGKAAADAPSPSALPHGAMLDSTAYVRLRAAHPEEFAPASVFFAHDDGSAMDRANSFRVKAALVYEAVTGQHVDDHMQLANSLLLALARQCHSKINGKGKEAGDHHPAADAEETDKGWDKEKKRVVDGIFLVVGFLPKLNEAISRTKDASRDAVDQIFKSRHMVDIVTDVIKLENQLHLQDLLNVARHAQDAIRDTLKQHPDFKDVKESMGSSEYNVTVHNLADVIHDFCWYYSPFATKRQTAAAPPFKDVVDSEEAAASRTLLDCLYMSVAKPPAAAQGKQQGGGGGPSRMPTARDLRRSGVRFQASENGRAEIEFAQPAVWLPALVYDFKLATVARNLLAREYGEQSKPVTRYFQMMNEMVEDAADVRILRRAGVVRGGSGGGQEVLELIKKIDGHASYPSVYMAMDREIDRVREYHDKRMASFFVRNRPGVIWASSVAAISVAAIVATRRKRG